MTTNGVLQILSFLGIIVLVTKPVGLFMSRLFQGERTFLHPALRPIEVLIYKLGGVREHEEQRWTQYAASLLSFSLFAFLITYGFIRLQGLLPLNPQAFSGALQKPDQAFNTAISFMTNTNWQNYSGESTMSYLVQMAAPSRTSSRQPPARGSHRADPRLRQEETDTRKLRVDGPRTVPADSALDRAALLFCSQGVIQNFHQHRRDDRRGATQTITLGPVASQGAIKQLGTNGGGFFNASSSHPPKARRHSPTSFRCS
jgi:K+-transporting ATPase ATPase A chain